MGNGLLSGAHHPLLVVGYLLASMVALGMAALSLMYDIDPTARIDNQRLMFEANTSVVTIAIGAAIAAALFAAFMRKWVLAIGILLLPSLAAGGMLGKRWYDIKDAIAAEDKRIATQKRQEEARQKRIKGAQKLRDRYADYCSDPKPISKAKKYRAKKSGPHRFLTIAEGYNKNKSFSSSYFLSNWEAAKRSELELIVCMTRDTNTLETCQYEKGYTVTRSTHPVTIQVYNARTGELVEQRTETPEKTPAACPYVISSNESYGKYRAHVDQAKLESYLKSLYGTDAKAKTPKKKKSKTKKSKKKPKKSKKSKKDKKKRK